MKRALIQITTVLVLSLCVMAVRFPFHDYGLGIFDSLKNTLHSQGIELDAEDIAFGFPAKIQLDNLSLVLNNRGGAIPLAVNKAVINPDISSLFFLKGVVRSTIEAYSGSLDTNIDYSLLGETLALKFQAKDFQLNKHPLLSANGISGVLRVSGDAELEPVEGKKGAHKIQTARALVQLENAKYEGNYKIKGFIPVPKMTDLRSEVSLTQTDNVTSIEDAKLFSSLGQLEARGTISTIDLRKLQDVELSGKISFTAEGEKKLAGYLALAAGLSPDAIARDWTFSLSKKANQQLPIFKATPLFK